MNFRENVLYFKPQVTQSNGRVVPVVQAYAFTKYLGFIKLTFDEQGELTSWAGTPILLNSSYPQGTQTKTKNHEDSTFVQFVCMETENKSNLVLPRTHKLSQPQKIELRGKLYTNFV